MVMSFDLDAGKNGHGMDELAKLHLGHECISFKSLCGTGKSQISFADVPLDKATEYAAEDADITFRLWQLLKLRLPQEGVTRVRSEEQTSELQSLMRISYAVFCLKKKHNTKNDI